MTEAQTHCRLYMAHPGTFCLTKMALGQIVFHKVAWNQAAGLFQGQQGVWSMSKVVCQNI